MENMDADVRVWGGGGLSQIKSICTAVVLSYPC